MVQRIKRAWRDYILSRWWVKAHVNGAVKRYENEQWKKLYGELRTIIIDRQFANNYVAPLGYYEPFVRFVFPPQGTISSGRVTTTRYNPETCTAICRETAAFINGSSYDRFLDMSKHAIAKALAEKLTESDIITFTLTTDEFGNVMAEGRVNLFSPVE